MKKKFIALILAVIMTATCVGAGVLNSPDIQLVDVESGESVSTVEIPRSERSEIAVDYDGSDLAYQWQLSSDGKTWINVYGQTEESIKLSYAMVCNMLSDDGTAQVRCIVTDADNKYESNTAEVSFVEDKAVSAVDNSAAAKPAAPAKAALQRSKAVPTTFEGEVKETIVVTINYVFADGTQAANPWTANVPKDEPHVEDVPSPNVVGYKPNQETVHVDTSTYVKDTAITVTYYPAEVEFTVKHYQQNVNNDNYTLVDTETKTGYTESPVGENLGNDYTGFYALLYDTTTPIAADGSTEVEIYYDRYYYLMKFDLDGGYGVEPIYARYGASISVAEPEKPGYKFKDWTPALLATMPAKDTSFKANWTAATSGFTVVFWYENANDNGYSVSGTYKPADVAPGTVKTSDDYKNQDFTGRDTKHFTYNEAKSDKVTVKGDGSTVLNVYFTRNTYTLTFKDGDIKIVCGKVEHEHSHEQCCTKTGWHISCNSKKCPVGYEHQHKDSCYKYSDLTITAKYQADIHSNFPIKDGNNTIWWIVPQGTETYGYLEEQRYLGSIDTMPGENITFEANDSESGAKIYYYVETINGAAGDKSYNGKNYKEYKVIDLDYSSTTSLTYREEFHPITGFTQGDSNPYLPKDGEVGMKENNYLYYTRNSYNLKFYNYNAYVNGKGGSVQFEAPLRSYNFEPEYPSKLEPNAYEFDGWYTTDKCYAGSEADLSTMTMPASDVVLFAKWVPKTHTVKTYQTKDAMDNGSRELQNWAVTHGSTVTDPPADPERKPYKFVGWFYDENGTEKAFDFSMPVNRDLNLYAKWSSNNLVEYKIHYRLEDGTEIAPDTTGSGLAGTTKTFDAKTGTQLNESYQTGYFPQTGSHSLTFDIEGKNEFTFVYVPKEKVKYTVRYLDKATGEPVVIDGVPKVPKADKVGETSDAVITEKFEYIKGYAPDAYQKKLVLSANENENVLIFWYTKDETHAPVQTIHWIQNIAGEGYTEYQSSTNLNGVIGNDYSATPISITGFKFNSIKSNTEGKLPETGLVLNLYYDREEYGYIFRFMERGTNTQLAAPVTGMARYQAQVTESAKTIDGYKLVSNENQSITIGTDEGKNVKTFWYEEKTAVINYEVVGPDGCGSVSPASETVNMVTGTANGSTATASNDTYKFVGWYSDEACENETLVSPNAEFVPEKSGTLWPASTTYYAKFDWNVADLTITKTGAEAIDKNQSFIFHVTGEGKDMYVTVQGNGSVTIKGLTVGTYTVKEVTSWSWRYEPDKVSKNVEVKGGQKNEVTFNNSRTNGSWLSGDSFAINRTGGRR